MIVFVHFNNTCYIKAVCTKYSKTNTQGSLCISYIK
jgi:hypothetical protein